jgi:hypothetical protein
MRGKMDEIEKEKLQQISEKIQQISEMRGKMDEIEKERLKMEHRAEKLT